MAEKSISREPEQICGNCIHIAACQSWNVGFLDNTDATHCVNFERSNWDRLAELGLLPKGGTIPAEYPDKREDHDGTD